MSDLPKTRRELVALIFKIAFLEAMALSLILPSVTSTGEVPTPCSFTSPSNLECNSQVRFHTTVFGSSNSSTSGIITTSSWTTIFNETIVAVPSLGNSFIASQVSTVTDMLGDTFTRQIYQPAPGSTESNEIEVWTALANTGNAPDAVTVTWNVTTNPILLVQVATYTGVLKIGAKTSTTANSGTSNSISITTGKSGSWIFGVSSIIMLNPCPTIVTSASFLRRIDSCPSQGVNGVETELSDNATAVRNLFTLAYFPSWAPNNNGFEQAVVELVPVDVEPNTPDFTAFCTTTGTSCCTPTNGQCVLPVTVQILFLPVISARSATAFTTIMYANPIPYTPSSIVASFQYLAHNATIVQSGQNQCTIAIGALSCSVSTTFPVAFIGVPNVVASSTTPSKTLPLP